MFGKRSSTLDSAFVFIKPWASTLEIVKYVVARLEKAKIRIVSQGKLHGSEIANRGIVGKQYPELRARGIYESPYKVTLTDEEKFLFKGTFGYDWDAAIHSGLVYNAYEACNFLELSPHELWDLCETSLIKVRLSEGFHCFRFKMPEVRNAALAPEAKISERKKMEGVSLDTLNKLVPFETFLEETEEKPALEIVEAKDIIVVNGFFHPLRESFEDPRVDLNYMVVEWDVSKLSWESFNQNIIGTHNPGRAAAGSIRGMLYNNWQDMGLSAQPDLLHNCVHASQSPLEGLNERMIWLKGSMIPTDSFGARLLAARLKSTFIKKCLTNPVVEGKRLFSHLKNKNSDDCISFLSSLYEMMESNKSKG